MLTEEKLNRRVTGGVYSELMAFCFFFLILYNGQLQKKLHQLEEQLDCEMQAKDELEQKCKYD